MPISTEKQTPCDEKSLVLPSEEQTPSYDQSPSSFFSEKQIPDKQNALPEYHDGEQRSSEQQSQKRNAKICGLRRRVFVCSLGLVLGILAVLSIGVAIGVSEKKGGSPPGPAPSETTSRYVRLGVRS